MDQVEARSLADGTANRWVDNVRVGPDRGNERIDVLGIEIRRDVDVERRTRIGWCHHPSRSGSQSNKAIEASLPRTRAA